MRHTLTETWSGLRRNASMTLAVVVTMWVSLTLFGAGLMTAQQVDRFKDDWYDRVEISVFLCVPDSRGGNCQAGESVTEAQRTEIEATLKGNPEVAEVFYETKEQAYAQFREYYANNDPILKATTVDKMQDSFRVKLKNPEEYQGVVSAVSGMPGVQLVQDLRKILDPMFTWLNLARWATVGLSALLLLAAALQIGNTIRMAAYSRRREIGIMRLVGASNWYIMAPFLLESLIAAVGGALLACLTLAAVEQFVIIGKAQAEIQTIRWIEWPHVGVAMASLAVVAVVLSIIPTLIATRRFLRV
ncbi:MAG TPA: permease-like cell division protein FtsX [Propionicimonas sp.]|uniref:permease-like cell division protein FtsX n=1 Tax=Propionicimonas sp. TaxID=1955623 RepID=UPI002F3E9A64